MEELQVTESKPRLWDTLRIVLYILGALVLFLFALDLTISSLQHLGRNTAETIIRATSNPFTGLFIGLLITAMIQSSSTTTALVVAMMASGALKLQNAIPIIMGANIGTTITSTIVSLGFISKRKEFRRAVAAGTYHCFFNLLTVIILFPLEYHYRLLSEGSQFITKAFFQIPDQGASYNASGFRSGFKPVIDFLVEIIPGRFILVVLSFVLLFVSILVFRRIISDLLKARSPEAFSRFFFRNRFKSFCWGLLTTAAIRSSTITTSVVVPIVAKKITALQQAAPFIMGANIGTTITALIAAMLYANTTSAVSIAIAHVLFNLIGVLIFFPVPVLRRVPIELAAGLGKITLKYRLAGFVFLLVTFFFIPFSLIYFNQDAPQTIEIIFRQNSGGDTRYYRLVSSLNLRQQTGEWAYFHQLNEENDQPPDLIYPVYLKNNSLFVGQEMFLFSKPGFCWDGEDKQGKFRACIEKIIPRWQVSPTLSFDSVYVCTRQYSRIGADSAVQKIYLSPVYKVILKREVYDRSGMLTHDEEIVRFQLSR